MIAIYEEAYINGIYIGLSNLAAHAYAQNKLDEWRDKSLEDFEQAFGAHYPQLGLAISGDALGNLQRLIAEGVPTVVVKTVSTTAETTVQELGTGTAASSAARPPISGPNASYLMANDQLVTNCTKVKPTPGWHNVFVHGNGNGFGLKINGQAVRVSPAMVKDAMVRTGYKGGPVILNSC